jgi:drug/metabolite transporter (DMT)-like permease
VLLGVITPAAGWTHMSLTPRVVGAIAALGVAGTGFAFVMYHGLIRDVGATTASMVTFIIPVVAVALGVVLLDEPLGWNLFAGGAVVIVGVALAEGLLRRGAKVPDEAAAASTDVITAPR